MTHQYLDLETFSTLPIKDTGSYRYAEDCEILMCAIDEKVIFEDFPTSGEYRVWNVGFEYPVLKQPGLKFIDVMQKAAAHGLPLSLEKCGKALNLDEDKQKLSEGKRLIRKFSIPRKPTKHNPNTRNTKETDPEDWDKFVQYCAYDNIAARSIDTLLPDLNPSEQALADLDLKINSRGIPIDIPLVKKTKRLIDEYSTEQIRRCKSLTGFSPNQRGQIMKWCDGQGYPLEGYTAKHIEAALQDNNCPGNVKEVLKIRQETSMSSLKKYDKLLAATCSDGRIRGTMQYHAAATGRWGGRLIQPQNLPRGTIDSVLAADILTGECDLKLLQLFADSPTEIFKSAIRSMIYSPKGFTFVDYAGIEARVVQWLVEDEAALQVFRDGKDVYKHMAALIFNVDYENVTKQQRFTGKQAILGLGYGMGVDKFIATCAGYGVAIETDVAQLTVDTYRTVHKKLKNYWYKIESAAIKTVRTRKKSTAGRVYFAVKGNFLYMVLPSKRCLAYPFPRIEEVETSWGEKKESLTYMTNNAQGQWVRVNTYGGKLLENLCQAAARDILGDALKKLDKAGYDIVMHIHDEVVIEGTHPVEEVSAIMCDLEPWAAGNVIDAEGFNSMRFRKD